MSQKVSTKYGTNSLGEMAFWHDESWSLYLHDIYTTSHWRKLSWSRLASSSRNMPFLPAARRNPGIAGSCHGADWLPSLSNTYRNLPFLPAASLNPGHKTTVLSPWWTTKRSVKARNRGNVSFFPKGTIYRFPVRSFLNQSANTLFLH